jgi:hypothetical protein
MERTFASKFSDIECINHSHSVILSHTVLTYIEYRAMSGVFRTIDPPSPLHPTSVSSPRGVTHSRSGEGAGGQYFGRRKTLDWSLTVHCIKAKSYPAKKSATISSGLDSIVMHSFRNRYCFCQSSKMMMNTSLVNSI